MALSPAVIEARIDLGVCELRVLAAQTAVDWGRAQQERRDQERRNFLPPPPDNIPR
jgi:hypothetical protein